MTQVSEAMTRDVRTISPDESVIAAAQAMEELDVGVLPVCDGERLVGIVTDRDIVIRGVAQVADESPIEETTVMDVMTEEALYCFEDEAIEEVQEKMAGAQVRRLPVIDREKHLVGMLSLADLAQRATPKDLGKTLEGISQPGGAGAGV